MLLSIHSETPAAFWELEGALLLSLASVSASVSSSVPVCRLSFFVCLGLSLSAPTSSFVCCIPPISPISAAFAGAAGPAVCTVQALRVSQPYPSPRSPELWGARGFLAANCAALRFRLQQSPYNTHVAWTACNAQPQDAFFHHHHQQQDREQAAGAATGRVVDLPGKDVICSSNSNRKYMFAGYRMSVRQVLAPAASILCDSSLVDTQLGGVSAIAATAAKAAAAAEEGPASAVVAAVVPPETLEGAPAAAASASSKLDPAKAQLVELFYGPGGSAGALLLSNPADAASSAAAATAAAAAQTPTVSSSLYKAVPCLSLAWCEPWPDSLLAALLSEQQMEAAGTPQASALPLTLAFPSFPLPPIRRTAETAASAADANAAEAAQTTALWRFRGAINNSGQLMVPPMNVWEWAAPWWPGVSSRQLAESLGGGRHRSAAAAAGIAAAAPGDRRTSAAHPAGAAVNTEGQIQGPPANVSCPAVLRLLLLFFFFFCVYYYCIYVCFSVCRVREAPACLGTSWVPRPLKVLWLMKTNLGLLNPQREAKARGLPPRRAPMGSTAQ